ncbi:glycerophosphodiester phosphodiesterase [Rheinheimera faecalis]
MQIIAHRGASGSYPENTLLAIKQALLAKADGIEIDVFCVENQLVVIHDENVSRTTNGTGLLQDFTLKQLQQLDAGSGQQVPTLWQVLQLVNNQTLLNIELKGADTAEPLLELLKKAETQLGTDPDKLLISSFNHHLLQHIKNHRPDLKTGALTASLPLDYAAFASELAAWSVNCDKGFINKEMVQDAHQRGLKVWVYTVNDAVTAKKMQQLGVDGIFCNYPLEARSW